MMKMMQKRRIPFPVHVYWQWQLPAALAAAEAIAVGSACGCNGGWSRGISGRSLIKKRVRDHGFDEYMDACKRVKKVQKLKKVLLDQPGEAIAVARLDTLCRRYGMRQGEAADALLRFRHVFEVFEHPVQRMLWCRLTPAVMAQMRDEAKALNAQEGDAVVRLQKLLMMAANGRLSLEHVLHARHEFGLPEDFETSVVPRYPELFRISGDDSAYAKTKYVEIVRRDPALAACAVEEARVRAYRQQGRSEDNVRFAFPMNFPPGFKMLTAYRLAIFKWQKLPYWSPYEDISQHDLRSSEAQKRLEKRAVATIHELLNITVEKRITLEKIAHFRHSFNLPNKLKNFLMQYQGIFYISTRGNQGKLHTIFLREAYRRGELIEPSSLYLARRKLIKLVLLSPRKAPLDESLAYGSKSHYYGDERETRQYLRNIYVADATSPARALNPDQNSSDEQKLLPSGFSDIEDAASDMDRGNTKGACDQV